MEKSKTFNQVLQAQFNDLCNAQKYSLRDLHTFLGISAAAISKYRNGKPEGDIQALETKIEDFIKQAALRLETQGSGEESLFETVVCRQIKNACETAKKHGMMSTVVGDPGLGKSCAIELYRRQDSLSISIELNTVLGGGTPSALVRAFFRQVSTGGFNKAAGTKGEWLVERFRKSGRLIIIDNAHLLSQNGLEWLLGFHDATGCPVVLIGNSELHQTIRKVQRAPSRVGVSVECSLRATLSAVVQEVLAAAWPTAGKEVTTLAIQVVERPGRLRTLRHIVRVARDWAANKKFKSNEDAFRAAMERQFQNYRLATV